MESRNQYHGIHPHAKRAIRHQANRLANCHLFYPWEVEDLEQELMFDLHKRLPCFNPNCSQIEVFISSIVRNHAISLTRSACTTRRNGGRKLLSLNTPVRNDDGTTVDLIDTIVDGLSLWSVPGRSWIETTDLRIDLERCLSVLPQQLHSFVIQLTTKTVAEVSASTGIPKTTLNDAIDRIRKHLQKASRKNLSKNSVTFRVVPVFRGYGQHEHRAGV